MRKIIITVTETKNGEEAIIEVDHFNDGTKSEVEHYAVRMLNDFLFTKVGDVSTGKATIKLGLPKKLQKLIDEEINKVLKKRQKNEDIN